MAKRQLRLYISSEKKAAGESRKAKGYVQPAFCCASVRLYAGHCVKASMTGDSLFVLFECDKFEEELLQNSLHKEALYTECP
eukprot:6196767-Pleurochrysis_carterae.AAC.3